MSAIGPDLPPHLLAKRKRRDEVDTTSAPSATPGAKAEQGQSPSEKRARVIGPAMPPASLDERPTNASEDSESSSEDDYGPSVPRGDHEKEYDDDTASYTEATRAQLEPQSKPQRDEWMTMAPTQDDLAARMDPSRVRARGFNTGRSARGGGGSSGKVDGPSAWHETAEQKQKRLADEVMGITGAAEPLSDGKIQARATQAANEAAAKRTREHMEKVRGPSLMERHREKEPEKAEDDISKRAFDREKDMSNASRITGTQKREMLNKASDYSTRFAGGSYL